MTWSLLRGRNDFFSTNINFLLLIYGPIFLTFTAAGRENDDGRGVNLRHLLAAVSRLLHSALLHPRLDQRAVHPGTLLGHLLAGHEQLHVQSHHLLLDELEVRRLIGE